MFFFSFCDVNKCFPKYVLFDFYLSFFHIQGYIHRILADTENGEIKLDQDVYSSMINLQNRTTEVVERMLPFLWKQDPLFYPVLNSSWTYFKPYKFLEPQDVVERQKIKPGDEEKYSNCVGEIVGSKESSMEPCTISDDCWGIMKSKGTPNKVLYYQALFFLLGEASGTMFSFIAPSERNPLHPSISMGILHIVLYTFPKVLTRRICVINDQELL